MQDPFDSSEKKRFTERFDGYAERILPVFPNLSWDLKRAGYSVDAVQYLSNALYITFAVFVAILLVTTVTPVLAGRAEGIPYMWIGLSLAIGFFVGSYFLYAPKIKINSKGRMIDKDLEYMLKDMKIQLSSGVPLFDAIANIARGGYGECSAVTQGIVNEVQAGKAITSVLEEVGLLSPSEYLRKVLWQIVNAVKSGSDVTIALEAISVDIQEAKENAIKAYGQELNLWGLIYMMGAVVAPSMGVTLLVILSSFLGGGFINEKLLWLVLFGLAVFQTMFILFLRSKRPIV